MVMFVWCNNDNTLGFQYNSPPKMRNDSYDNDVCYFIKIAELETNVFSYN